MRHAVEEIVHAELVRLVGVVHRPQSAAGPFPELRDVGVVVDDHDEPLLRIVVLVDAFENRPPRVVGLGKIVERLNLEKRVKDRMRHVHVEELHAGEDTVHVPLERVPAAGAVAAPADGLEVVDDDEAAFLDVGAQRGGARVAQRPPADFDDVCQRILEQLRIFERDHVDLVRARVEEAEVVHDPHQVLFRERIPVDPGRPSAGPVAARRGVVLDADEGELTVVRDVVDGRRAGVFVESEPVVEASLSQGSRRETQRQGYGDQESATHRWILRLPLRPR